MTIIQAIILGITQGITEFLPISSSGHLVILPYFLNWNLAEKESFIFNVLVQIGTLVSVIYYFRNDLLAIIRDFFKDLFAGKPFASSHARMGWLLIVATIPAGLAGLLLNDRVEQAFSSPLFAGIALLITALLMIAAEIFSRNKRLNHEIKFPTAIVMGLMQALSIFPGISRSGSTISGGMFSKVHRKSAGRFSFLMSIPIMLAAGGLSTYQMVTEVANLGEFLPIMAIGFLTAMIVGYFSIRWLLGFLAENSLVFFSIYCFLLGSVTILHWIL